MGKNLDLLHCLLGSCQFFESPLNIHKMSQVICRHFWVGWPWENLPRLLSVWSSSDWLFFQSYGEVVNASCIPILLCQSCLVTHVSCFVQRMLAYVGLLSVSFLIYPGHPQCQVGPRSFQIQFGDHSYTWFEVEDPSWIWTFFDIFVPSTGLRLSYHLLH